MSCHTAALHGTLLTGISFGSNRFMSDNFKVEHKTGNVKILILHRTEPIEKKILVWSPSFSFCQLIQCIILLFFTVTVLVTKIPIWKPNVSMMLWEVGWIRRKNVRCSFSVIAQITKYSLVQWQRVGCHHGNDYGGYPYDVTLGSHHGYKKGWPGKKNLVWSPGTHPPFSFCQLIQCFIFYLFTFKKLFST